MAAKAYRVALQDNVAVMLTDVARGQTVAIDAAPGAPTVELVALSDIPAGHKIALCDLEAGAEIVKYGAIIGAASACIHVGEHVHVHNMRGLRGRGDRE